MSTKKQIALSRELAIEVQRRLARIQELERDLSAHRDGLNWLLLQTTGVNLARENWTLDPDHWTLTKE